MIADALRLDARAGRARRAGAGGTRTPAELRPAAAGGYRRRGRGSRSSRRRSRPTELAEPLLLAQWVDLSVAAPGRAGARGAAARAVRPHPRRGDGGAAVQAAGADRRARVALARSRCSPSSPSGSPSCSTPTPRRSGSRPPSEPVVVRAAGGQISAPATRAGTAPGPNVASRCRCESSGSRSASSPCACRPGARSPRPSARCCRTPPTARRWRSAALSCTRRSTGSRSSCSAGCCPSGCPRSTASSSPPTTRPPGLRPRSAATGTTRSRCPAGGSGSCSETSPAGASRPPRRWASCAASRARSRSPTTGERGSRRGADATQPPPARRRPRTDLFTVLYAIVDPSRAVAILGQRRPSAAPTRAVRSRVASYLTAATSRWGRGHRVPRYARRLEPGDALVLYTDGLVERRGESLDIGFERLAAAVRAGPADPDALCESRPGPCASARGAAARRRHGRAGQRLVTTVTSGS